MREQLCFKIVVSRQILSKERLHTIISKNQGDKGTKCSRRWDQVVRSRQFQAMWLTLLELCEQMSNTGDYHLS